MKKNYINEETLDSINRMRLLMGYDSKKTLTENYKTILSETISMFVSNTDEPATNEDTDVYREEDGYIKSPDGWIYGGKDIEIKGKITDINIQTMNWVERDGTRSKFNDLPIEQKKALLNPPVVSRYVNGRGDEISLHVISEGGVYKSTKYYMTSPGQKTQEYDPMSQKNKDEMLSSGYVWDPECETETQELTNQGIRTKKKKTGCYKKLPATDGFIDEEGKRLISLRIDKYGNKVPYGFDVDCYKEYLDKIVELEKENKACQERANEIFQKNPTDYLGTGGEFNRNEGFDCGGQLLKAKQALYDAYHHEDFPYGLCPDDYKNYKNVTDKYNKEREDKISAFENKHKCKWIATNRQYVSVGMAGTGRAIETGIPDKGYYVFDKNCLSDEEFQEYVDLKDKYDDLLAYMYTTHQYDPASSKELSKSAIEKWWDKWGWAGEMVFWVAADYFTAGWAETVSAGRQGYLLTKLIPQVIRYSSSVGLPAGFAIYDMIKNDGRLTTEGAMYFMFACLPIIHDLMKIPKPSKQDVQGLVSLLKKYPPNTPENMQVLMSSLNSQQKKLFREVASKTPEEIKSMTKEAWERLAKDFPHSQRKALIKSIRQSERSSQDFKFNLWWEQFKKNGGRMVKEITSMEGVKFFLQKFGIIKEGLEEEFKKRLDTLKLGPKDQLSLMIYLFDENQKNPSVDAKTLVDKTVDSAKKSGYQPNHEQTSSFMKKNPSYFEMKDENGNIVTATDETLNDLGFNNPVVGWTPPADTTNR